MILAAKDSEMTSVYCTKHVSVILKASLNPNQPTDMFQKHFICVPASDFRTCQLLPLESSVTVCIVILNVIFIVFCCLIVSSVCCNCAKNHVAVCLGQHGTAAGQSEAVDGARAQRREERSV